MSMYEKLATVQQKLKAPKTIKEGSRTYFLVNCTKCNKEMKVRSDYIKKHSGVCTSCQKKNNVNAVKHGDYNTRLYHIWQGLWHRRYKTHKPKICKEWEKYENFKAWAIQNGYNDNLTIDRINNSGDYEHTNCQWITLEENASKDKKIFSLNDEMEVYKSRKELGITQREMANRLNVSRNTIQRAEKQAKECI